MEVQLSGRAKEQLREKERERETDLQTNRAPRRPQMKIDVVAAVRLVSWLAWCP